MRARCRAGASLVREVVHDVLGGGGLSGTRGPRPAPSQGFSAGTAARRRLTTTSLSPGLRRRLAPVLLLVEPAPAGPSAAHLERLKLPTF